jgi:hypothetical protein
MEEVLGWFQDEKKRREQFYAKISGPGLAMPLSPAATTTPGTAFRSDLVVSQYTSPGTMSYMEDGFSPRDSVGGDELDISNTRQIAIPTKARRGRPAKSQSLRAADFKSPALKRQKCTTKYPCPDCDQSFTADRWVEHVKRVHFPEQIWECPKLNLRTGTSCGSKPFFRIDNFTTHLKGEHDCSFEEIARLKTDCKHRTANLFHQFCGFCEVKFENREESIEHIKNHFGIISRSFAPPADLGLSDWKHKCASDHKVRRGVHYQICETTESPRDETQECCQAAPDGGQSEIPSIGNAINPAGKNIHPKEEDQAADNSYLYFSSSKDCPPYDQHSAQHQRSYLDASLDFVPPQVNTISGFEGCFEFGEYDGPEGNFEDPSICHDCDRSPNGRLDWSVSQFPTYADVPEWSSSPVFAQPPEDDCVPYPGNSSRAYTHIDSQSLVLSSHYHSYQFPEPRRSELLPYNSYNSSNKFSNDGSRERSQCIYSGCGKTFKDLKAHMLTHQNERPEKCPIQTCDYHVKGFARKYDKMRHTLTHYKGAMICGFCPSSAGKTFNRADVFKRHLTSVHGVDQTPPNSRKQSSGSESKPKMASATDATGNCSTCNGNFGNAQEFYEHLDGCVLKIVQQQEPWEATNARQQAEV